MIYSDDIQNDVLSLALNTTANRVFTVQVDCFNGHSLSLGQSVTNMEVEAKHSGDVSYTNLEVDSIDLSTWAGTQQDFNLRFTAGVITTPLIRAFRLRVGPTIVVPLETAVLNDSEDPVFNDSEDPIYTEI